ncbi:hypothetical protein [Kitasatospora sp. NPDC002965]|uniref:hypothetical protein n=1 Tax=Kitasatospora sp. NPDC002965 TaxID=3154775 RepID=UPI0033A106CD
MVDHRELFEDVTTDLARAGFDTGRGPSGLRIGHRPQGVVVDWRPVDPADGAGGSGEVERVDPPPVEGIRAAVTGAVAVVLRESGYQVAATGRDELLVTAGPARAVEAPAGPARDEVAVPEQWWG